MLNRSIAALALIAVFSFPIAADAVTNAPAPSASSDAHRAKKLTSKKKRSGVTNSVPGGPGFTGSSPLGSAEKKSKKS